MPFVTIDTRVWNARAAELRKFEPAMLRQMRKRIKIAGEKGVEAVRRELEKPSPAGGPNEGDGREALAAGTSIVVSFAKSSAGVKIRTASSKLPTEHKGLLNVYNMPKSRHPVFGRDVWVQQEGRPYFGAAIEAEMDGGTLLHEMRAAIDDACFAIGARGR